MNANIGKKVATLLLPLLLLTVSANAASGIGAGLSKMGPAEKAVLFKYLCLATAAEAVILAGYGMAKVYSYAGGSAQELDAEEIQGDEEGIFLESGQG